MNKISIFCPEMIVFISVSRHHSLITEYKNICFVTQIQADDSFVVCGWREGQWELVGHRLPNGTRIDQVVLRGTRPQAQEVVFQGRPALP